MTRLLEYLAQAFEALMRNKVRTFLTMLGMLIGVAAVLSVYGLSAGAAAAINSNVNSSDNPSLTAAPDPQQANPAIAQLNYRDYRVVEDALGGLATRVTPYYAPSFGQHGIYNVRRQNKHVVAFGWSWYGGDAKFQVLAGRALTAADEHSHMHVAVVNPDLAFEFFGSHEGAIGEQLEVRGTRFTIVGVANDKQGTAAGYFGGNYYFVLPYTTFHDFSPGAVDGLYIWLDSPSDEDAAKRVLLDTLHRVHGKRAAYRIQSNREILQTTKRVVDVVAAGLTAIGAISLLVAGIGIMNIMLVSVTERTREIGIRKSIGASRRDIVVQFLSEAALISVFGGLLGFLLSLLALSAASSALAAKMGSLPIPYANLFLYGLSFSIVIGITFGVYPALRASRLNPVEALRS
ncbi:MAG TPA: ABC transporter permease [Candidatus Baltobacteraceae bacterium]|nr:ABC transporter permease [Candidatus Baltobacteraceae bacterium]